MSIPKASRERRGPRCLVPPRLRKTVAGELKIKRLTKELLEEWIRRIDLALEKKVHELAWRETRKFQNIDVVDLAQETKRELLAWEWNFDPHMGSSLSGWLGAWIRHTAVRLCNRRQRCTISGRFRVDRDVLAMYRDRSHAPPTAKSENLEEALLDVDRKEVTEALFEIFEQPGLPEPANDNEFRNLMRSTWQRCYSQAIKSYAIACGPPEDKEAAWRARLQEVLYWHLLNDGDPMMWAWLRRKLFNATNQELCQRYGETKTPLDQRIRRYGLRLLTEAKSHWPQTFGNPPVPHEVAHA